MGIRQHERYKPDILFVEFRWPQADEAIKELTEKEIVKPRNNLRKLTNYNLRVEFYPEEYEKIVGVLRNYSCTIEKEAVW